METPPHRVDIGDALDLHTFAPRDVPSVVEEYVNEAHRHGLTEVRFIHGRGIGVQRRAVHTVLERHPLVVELWDAPESRLGATVARLAGGETQAAPGAGPRPEADEPRD
ncbi:MAG: Smr/MutS family protein [Acidobacteria bacterium]|nr:Smr/MutS family protein [Acidobacteriota bacterium]